MTFTNVDLITPKARSLDTFLFAIAPYMLVQWALRRMPTFDPSLVPPPAWFRDVCDVESEYVGKKFMPWLDERSYAVGPSFDTNFFGPLSGKPDELNAAIRLMSAEQAAWWDGQYTDGGGVGDKREGVREKTLVAKGALSQAPMFAWAKAAGALKLARARTMPGLPLSDSENAQYREALAKFEHVHIRDFVALTTFQFLTGGAPNPNAIYSGAAAEADGGLKSNERTGYYSWLRVLWYRAYTSLMSSPYLWAMPPEVANDENFIRDNDMKALNRERRMASVWWRLRLDPYFYVLKSMAAILFVPDTVARLKAEGMEGMFDYVKTTLDRPASWITNGLLAWQRTDSGPSPLGHAPRKLVDAVVWDKIREAIAAGTTGAGPARRDMVDVFGRFGVERDTFPVARAFVEHAYHWSRQVRGTIDSAAVDIPAAEGALGFTRAAPPWGQIHVPYANFRALYTDGEGFSAPSISLGEVGSVPILPLAHPNASGMPQRVGMGGFTRVVTRSPTLLPPSLLPEGLAARLASDIYVYLMRAQPYTTTPHLPGSIDPRCVRPLEEYLGQASARFISLERILEDLTYELGASSKEAALRELSDILLTTRTTWHDDGDTGVVRELDVGLELSKGTLRVVAGSALAKSKYKVGYYDPQVGQPWMYRLTLRPQTVWPGANPIYIMRGSRLLEPSQPIEMAYGVARDDTPTRAEYSTQQVFGKLISGLAETVLPVKA